MITWFARNGVAANLLMLVIVAAGLWALNNRMVLEMFPATDPNVINIEVSYPGAPPAEVESGVILKIEQAIAELEGIEALYSNALEGTAQIRIEVEDGASPRELMDDLTSRIDGIRNLPDEAERPTITLQTRTEDAISVIVSGRMDEFQLRTFGEQVRNDLVNEPGITRAELTGVRPREISVEISEARLREFGLSLGQVAEAIRQSSVDVPAGAIKTSAGEVLIRTVGQAYTGAEYADIVVLSRGDGSRVSLGDIATIRDGFSEDPLYARFDGELSAIIEVYRTGSQSVVDVADAAKAYIARKSPTLPDGIELGYWRDRSTYVKGRLDTLLRSAVQGSILIFIVLALFLRLSVALWVTVGIPISFMGALALMPELGLTMNLATLFAFILVLGIVVDDAIVTGENIYRHLKTEEDPETAAINGTLEIATPVTFGVLTTVVAFMPLLLIEGRRGAMFSAMALVVIPVMLFSLVESKLILPAHMKHIKRSRRGDKTNPLQKAQRAIADGLERGIERYYRPLLEKALQWRYATAAFFTAILIVILTFVMTGHYTYIFFPRIASETARATLTMPVGTPIEITEQHIQHMFDEARKLQEKYREPDDEPVMQHILTRVGHSNSNRTNAAGKSNIGQVSFVVLPPEDRESSITISEIVAEWRKNIGAIPGAEDLNFRAELGRGGNPVDIQLQGPNFEQLVELSDLVKAQLGTYPGLYEIKDTFEQGKEELKLNIRPEAESLGLTQTDLGRQVRDAFYGQEAQRIQRGRDEIKVMVRYPRDQRDTLETLHTMPIRTDAGDEVPFSSVADIDAGRSYAVINRVDRNRTVNVTADLDKEKTSVEEIVRDLNQWLPQLLVNYPDVRYSFEGEQKEQRESFGSMQQGLLFTLFAIYGLLAIPFKSYVQPLIVMLIIPFSVIGAILGHMIMGYSLSMTSLLGMLALTGVVVNDSLVLVDYVNRKRKEGMPLEIAVRTAGVARFRAILLTSLTTFVGLVPLMADKSTQAQFLIPMGISLGWGILFATFLTLILVPATYLIVEDVRRLFSRHSNPQS